MVPAILAVGTLLACFNETAALLVRLIDGTTTSPPSTLGILLFVLVPAVTIFKTTVIVMLACFTSTSAAITFTSKVCVSVLV